MDQAMVSEPIFLTKWLQAIISNTVWTFLESSLREREIERERAGRALAKAHREKLETSSMMGTGGNTCIHAFTGMGFINCTNAYRHTECFAVWELHTGIDMHTHSHRDGECIPLMGAEGTRTLAVLRSLMVLVLQPSGDPTNATDCHTGRREHVCVCVCNCVCTLLMRPS